MLIHSFHKFTQSFQANSLIVPELATESTVLKPEAGWPAAAGFFFFMTLNFINDNTEAGKRRKLQRERRMK